MAAKKDLKIVPFDYRDWEEPLCVACKDMKPEQIHTNETLRYFQVVCFLIAAGVTPDQAARSGKDFVLRRGEPDGKPEA